MKLSCRALDDQHLVNFVRDCELKPHKSLTANYFKHKKFNSTHHVVLKMCWYVVFPAENIKETI